MALILVALIFPSEIKSTSRAESAKRERGLQVAEEMRR